MEDQKPLLDTLLPKWIDLYDRALLYFFAVAFGVASVLGKEIIVSGRTLNIVFATYSTGSWYLLWTTLLFASFLLWYNYLSEVLVATNLALAKVDPSYRAFILDKDRLCANVAFLALSHMALFSPPLAVLLYYNWDLGFGWEFSWFALLARCCLALYCSALFLRVRTLLVIGAKVRRLRSSTPLPPNPPI